jgi:hypothetical protein
MSDVARVDDLDPIKDFRVYLVKFQEMASRALGDADSDIHRMARWLEGEGLNHWTSQIRKRQEALQKAEEALRFKRLYKDASGSTPSAVEEMKQVKICKDRLQQAQEKLSNVKKWSKALQKEVTLYRGGVSRFSNDVSAGVPAMISHLGAMINNLEKYMSIEAEAASDNAGVGAGAGSLIEASGASMARAADEREEEKEIKAEALRGSIPSEQAMMQAKPVAAGPVELSCGKATEEQTGEIAKIASGDIGDHQTMVISPAIFKAQRIFVARLDTAGNAWYVGKVGGKDTGVFNTMKTGDWRTGRPDLAELLRLPVGFIAVVGSNGVEAVFNGSNENVLQLIS